MLKVNYYLFSNKIIDAKILKRFLNFTPDSKSGSSMKRSPSGSRSKNL